MRHATFMIACGAVLLLSQHALAWRSVAFGVKNYQESYNNCTASQLNQAANSASNFADWVRLLYVGDSLERFNNNVRSQFLEDPNLSGTGDDTASTWGFDASTLRWFSGHGDCKGHGSLNGLVHNCDLQSNPPQWCASNSSAAATEWGPVTCRANLDTNQSDNIKGTCRWHYKHGPITCSTDNPGTVDQRQSVYTKEDSNQPASLGKLMRLETPGVAFFEISCPVSLDQPDGLTGLFNGLTAAGTIHVVNGDSYISQDRGDFMGWYMYSEPSNRAIADMWMDVASDVSGTPDCPHPSASMDAGINGCGGHVFMATGPTEATALTKVNVDRAHIATSYSNGSTWVASVYNCNYDCWQDGLWFP